MNGNTSGSPYKLASAFKQAPDDDNQYVLELTGPSGMGLVFTSQPGTIQAVMAEAEQHIRNTPTLMGYHL